jgi:hypothetical protein
VSTLEVVNLRGADADPSNATAGTLIGTATLPAPYFTDDPKYPRYPDDEPPLIQVWMEKLGPAPVLFSYVKGSAFSFGGSPTAEYIEVKPLQVVDVTLAPGQERPTAEAPK